MLPYVRNTLNMKRVNFLPRILDRAAAAYYLGVSPNTFDRFKIRKIPLSIHRFGYDIQDLDSYVELLKNGSDKTSNPWDE
jgi:hypothetical protein